MKQLGTAITMQRAVSQQNTEFFQSWMLNTVRLLQRGEVSDNILNCPDLQKLWST